MLHLVRNNSPYTAILLFLLTLTLHLQALTHAVLPHAEASQFVYGWLLHGLSYIFGKSAFAYTLFSVLLLFVQALIINRLAIRHRLFMHQHYLPAFCFIVLSSLNPALSVFGAPLICNFLLLGVMHLLLASRNHQNANKQIFNLGFLIMPAALLEFPAVVFVLYAFVALLIIRPFSFREWMVMLLGLVMPLYILVVILFCTDKLQLLHLWPELGVSLPRQLKPAEYYLGVAGGLIVWLCICVYNMQSQLPKAPIFIRRSWIVVTLLLFFSLIAACFTAPSVQGGWMICLPALSLILAQAFSHERNKKVNRISFYFVLALVIFAQIFLPL